MRKKHVVEKWETTSNNLIIIKCKYKILSEKVKRLINKNFSEKINIQKMYASQQLLKATDMYTHIYQQQIPIHMRWIKKINKF